MAEINSCYFVEKETEDESRGQIDSWTIGQLRKSLDAVVPKSREWIKVALVHHHPVLLPSFLEPGRGVDSILNARSLIGVLRDHGFQLILHGHKHFPQVFSYDADSAWATAEAAIPQLVIAGGSAGSVELPEASQKCNTYNMIAITWNPKALQARVQVVTRGLIRVGETGMLDPDQWRWKTLRIFDRVLSPYEGLPLPGIAARHAFPDPPDNLEEERETQYRALRFNMPVVEVLPSLMPGQRYEARVWLCPYRHHSEFPKRVTWSAGKWFSRKTCERSDSDEFCVSFHYWGPMLIQAELEFGDGTKASGFVYARLPDQVRRR